MSEMRIIPVLDVLNGVTVQAVAGCRDNYRAVRSCLTDSVDPVVVLQHLADICRSGIAYVADLDAILHRKLNHRILTEMSQTDLSLMVDAGIQSCDDVRKLLSFGIEHVVVGLESLPGPEVACELIKAFGADPLILSLDLQSGVPLARNQAWAHSSSFSVLEELIHVGFQRWIILDLAAVGTATGVPTVMLCEKLRRLRPDDEVITGGGIRTVADLDEIQVTGVDGVLIASALHTGAVSVEEISEWRRGAAES